MYRRNSGADNSNKCDDKEHAGKYRTYTADQWMNGVCW